MVLHNCKYHLTRRTDRYVRGLLNKPSPTNPNSTKETQCERLNFMWNFCSVWYLYIVWNFYVVWHLDSTWNFCSVWHCHSVWSFCYIGRSCSINIPSISERVPRFLRVRKRVSAYDLFQCPCYRFSKRMYESLQLILQSLSTHPSQILALSVGSLRKHPLHVSNDLSPVGFCMNSIASTYLHTYVLHIDTCTDA